MEIGSVGEGEGGTLIITAIGRSHTMLTIQYLSRSFNGGLGSKKNIRQGKETTFILVMECGEMGLSYLTRVHIARIIQR